MPLPQRAFAAALVLSLCAPVIHAQSNPRVAADSRIPTLLKELGKVRTPNTAAISPDGKTVAWAFNGAHGSELHLTRLAAAGGAQDGARERVLSPDTVGEASNGAAGACSASHPTWSPDGSQLAFLSDCSGSEGNWQPGTQNNLFVWTVATNGMKQVGNLHGLASSMRWSPDGKSIGFLYVENATRRAGALDAMKPWSGVIGEDGVEIQRVGIIDLATGEMKQVTAPNRHVYEFDWSPDSEKLVFVAAVPPGENNWWIAELWTQDLKQPTQSMDTTAATNVHLVFSPSTTPGPLHGLQIAVPRWSPDGKTIAFIGGLMSDQGSIGGDIYLIPAAGVAPMGQPRDLTPNRTASPAWITWLDDGSLGVSEHLGGGSHLTAIDVKTGKDDPNINLTLPETVIAGTDVMSVSTSHTENIALIRESYDRAPEVWAGPLNGLKQVSHLNDDAKPAWGKSESIDYSNEGFHVQGWLLYPANYDPAKKYPLIVSIHGGPSNAAMPRWPGVMYGPTPFSALGYFVFMPNPRGSYGQGEKFTQANVKDFGYGDLRDVLAGMDILEKRFPIDKDREGVTGWSYGGFMTMFGVTQTTRFKAAVAGAGISDWQSYYGENSIDQWMVPFFGATVYDDPAIYAKSSAIDFIKKVKTPTLVVVGDRDGECPAPQSFEFWHALKAEDVKTELVVYPNEGHRFVNPAHQSDVLRRALDWFETEMPAK
jgi:dipeptidyl aminopeptidase/acylaminoacyl peptidase